MRIKVKFCCILLMCSVVLLTEISCLAQYKNPILPGFYPDPSVCRVGDDYFLVTSSFEYFPGVPIFHSKDLINWRQIGHCLNRDTQLNLSDVLASDGIFAATIRYNDGIYYMVTSIVLRNTRRKKGIFYVTTRDPFSNNWSEPIFTEQLGIDPDLYFENGKTYLTGTSFDMSEIDIKTGKSISPPKTVWKGTGGLYPEGPHIYKKGEYYYLLESEGGTEYNHNVNVARSRDIFGPYQPYSGNPILTHKDRPGHRIQGTGHGDFVEAKDGSWWMVNLAFRPVGGNYHHLGRETFLTPVEWNDEGWPIINKNKKQEIVMNVPTLPETLWPLKPEIENFETSDLGHEWNYLRNPISSSFSLSERPGWLRLKGSSNSINDTKPVTFVGQRQTAFNFEVVTSVDFDPTSAKEEAGLVVIMDNKYHYDCTIMRGASTRRIVVKKVIGKVTTTIASRDIPEGIVKLKVKGEPLNYSFSFSIGPDSSYHPLATLATKDISTEVIYDYNQAHNTGQCCNFTGVYIGLYSSGNGTMGKSNAYFDWFKYKAMDDQISPEVMSFYPIVNEDKTVSIVFKTSWEKDIEKFDVEKSSDGVSFTTHTSLASIGSDTSQLYSYQTHDFDPYFSTTFYRIKAFYKTGAVSYSQIVPIRFSGPTSTVKPEENDNVLFYFANDYLNYRITSNDHRQVKFHLTDVCGRVFTSDTLTLTKGKNEGSIPGLSLPDRLLFVKIEGMNVPIVKKIIK